MQNASNPIVYGNRLPAILQDAAAACCLHRRYRLLRVSRGGNRVLRYNNCDVLRPGVVFAECRRLVFETAHFYALLSVSVRNYQRSVIE